MHAQPQTRRATLVEQGQPGDRLARHAGIQQGIDKNGRRRGIQGAVVLFETQHAAPGIPGTRLQNLAADHQQPQIAQHRRVDSGRPQRTAGMFARQRRLSRCKPGTGCGLMQTGPRRRRQCRRQRGNPPQHFLMPAQTAQQLQSQSLQPRPSRIRGIRRLQNVDTLQRKLQRASLHQRLYLVRPSGCSRCARRKRHSRPPC